MAGSGKWRRKYSSSPCGYAAHGRYAVNSTSRLGRPHWSAHRVRRTSADNVDCVCHRVSSQLQALGVVGKPTPHREELSLLDSVGQQCFPNVVLQVADVSSHPPPKTSQGYLRSALWLEPQFERPRRSSGCRNHRRRAVRSPRWLPLASTVTSSCLTSTTRRLWMMASWVSVETEVCFQDAHKYLCKGRESTWSRRWFDLCGRDIDVFFNFSQCGFESQYHEFCDGLVLGRKCTDFHKRGKPSFFCERGICRFFFFGTDIHLSLL